MTQCHPYIPPFGAAAKAGRTGPASWIPAFNRVLDIAQVDAGLADVQMVFKQKRPKRLSLDLETLNQRIDPCTGSPDRQRIKAHAANPPCLPEGNCLLVASRWCP